MFPAFIPSNPSEVSLHCFSSIMKAKAIKLYDNGLIANGDKGYRSVLGTQGVTEGSYYYEVTILNPSSESLNIPSNPIPPSAPMLEPLLTTSNMLYLETHDTISIHFNSAHTRIGFATAQTDLELPIGADSYSYSYRDLDGGVFHEGYINEYADSYGYNDIIGCLIRLQPQKPKIRGVIEEGPVVSEGSEIHYFKNGEHMGCAFSNIYEGCYYPAVGLYQYARVEINMTPNLLYPKILKQYNAKPFFNNHKYF
ncbi:unnamed protein product [Blepharisma stoltei]|uniref:B30.2/SPRY domain-containing protein n=1 Tax=Blepharisma stoltei TaxID=1481888 RepID=A0AAU9JJ20_9CILI|nr:unnamed protein product [Blepharisma stoltei]